MYFKIVSLLALFTLHLSCQDKTVATEITVKAVNEGRNPILNANVVVNNTFQGKTNTLGFLQFKADLEVGSRVVIQVEKESDSLYYAPYFENLVIKSDQTKIDVKATLYSVPKPKDPSTTLAMETSQDVPDVKAEKESDESIPDTNQIEPVASEAITEQEDPQTPEDTNLAEIVPTQPAIITNQEISQEQKQIPIRTPITTQNESVKETGSISFYLKDYIPLKGEPAEILIGQANSKSFQSLCKVNTRGRCTVQLKQTPIYDGVILVKGEGYQSQQIVRDVFENDKIHIPMIRGNSLDIQAYQEKHGNQSPLQNISVFIDGKLVGKTNKFGQYTHPLKNPKGDLISVSLRSPTLLPKETSSDFVIGGNISYTKIFTTAKSEALHLALAPTQIAGKLQGKTLPTFTEAIQKNILSALNRNFFSLSTFKYTPLQSLPESINLSEVLKSGWGQLADIDSLDGIIVPTIVIHQTKTLEINIIDAKGHSIVAAKEELRDLNSIDDVNEAISKIVEIIRGKFPYEGVIASQTDDQFQIDLKHNHPKIAIGDRLAVYGTKTDSHGQEKMPGLAGYLRISKITPTNELFAVVEETLPRSTIEAGDRVVYKGQSKEKQRSQDFSLHITDSVSKQAIQQASVYFGQDWVGSTTEDGLLKTSEFPNEQRLLRIIKHGYQAFAKEMKITNGGFEVKLVRVSSFVRIESVPTGMSAFIDKIYIGKTPINQAVAVPGGFAKLEILGENGYKNYKKVVELKDEILDLTGANAIQLEQDLKNQAKQVMETGQIDQALAILEGIPEQHSDYLIGQHEAGIIYMSLLNKPDKAAAAFHQVTSNPEVESFRDKRFIGSHINEGIALFLTGKNLELDQEDVAMAHYEKAIQVLDRATPFLRNMNEAEYQMAFENLYYYKALSHQRIGELSKNITHLSQAEMDWDTLLSARKEDANPSSLVKNASIYRKQLTLAVKTKGSTP